VTSRRDEGTTFIVTLPLKPSGAAGGSGEMQGHAA